MEWKESRNLDRPVWDSEAILGESGLFGNWRLCGELSEAGRGLLVETCVEIRRRLQQYGRDDRNFGLIHTDLRAANLLVEGELLKVLDFDDCGFGWHLFDLAASFSFIEDRPEVPGWTREWLEGYTNILHLEQRDYDMIPTFLMARRIQLLAWITSHDDSEPVKVYEKGFAERTVTMAKAYYSNSTMFSKNNGDK